jgi:hypothetical protein
VRRALAALALTVLLLGALTLTAHAAAPRPSGFTTGWAVVGVDGTLARGSGAVTARQLGTDGYYVVGFNRDVSQCAYVASGGTARAQDILDDAVVFTVAPSATSPSEVAVLEYDTILARDSYSSGFHLVVAC